MSPEPEAHGVPLSPPQPAGPAASLAILAAIGSICVVGLATGLTLPLVSLQLLRVGASAAVIAALAALPAVGTIGISFFLARLTRALGPKALMSMALLLSCASILVLASPYSAPLWILSRLTMGIAAGILFALGEARILEISSAQARGRWTGFYASMLTACQFAGPALLAALGPFSRAPLFIGAALHLVSFGLLSGGSWSGRPAAHEPRLALSGFLRSCLPLAAAVVFFSMFDSTMLALLPVYGLRLGLLTQASILMLTVVFLGDACLQVPIGWAADRLGRRGVHTLCALCTGLIALLLPLAAPSMPLIWPALFLMGGLAGAVYTLAIVRIGDRFSGGALIAANAFVGLLWGLGSLAGPLIGTAAMQAYPPHGLMLFVGAAAFACLLLMSRRERGL